MLTYILRRLLYAVPVLLGVNLITFALFFLVNSPDNMARAQLGDRYVNQAAVERWKEQHGYAEPLFYNDGESGWRQWTQTLFFQKSLELFAFDFGRSDAGRNINEDIRQRMGPSLAIAVPTLMLGLLVNIVLALLVVLFRGGYVALAAAIICVMLMSISSLFYIISGQYFVGKVMQLVPISGYTSGWDALRFVMLPIVIGVVAGIGSGTRWYRTLFLEEIHQDYVRTARAKGLSELRVLFTHVLKNALIPILTGVVVVIPALFMGSLIMESFFGIPGLGSYTIEAIANQDFAIVRSMVFLGSVLYIAGLILTDISYTFVDPRIRLA